MFGINEISSRNKYHWLKIPIVENSAVTLIIRKQAGPQEISSKIQS